jgi:tetratricopeptide (TPR) repeat protein
MNATVAEQALAPAIDLAGYLESAFRDFRQGRLDEATTSCREILSHHPDQADAWFLLGVIATRSGQIEKSIECHEKAVALRRAYARYHEALGRAYRSAKRPDAAAESLEQAIRLAPRLATAHLELGLTELDRGRAKPGLRHYRRAFGLLFGGLAKGLWLRTLYVTAAPLLGLLRWLTARRCTLGAALDIEKGRLCVWHREYEMAVKHFQSALRRAPDCVPALAALGRQMFFLENYSGAAETLARSVELCPGDAELLASSAMATFRMGRYDDAADMAQKALARRPKSVQGRLALGFSRVQQNRPEEAMGEFEEILRHDRRNVDALLGEARILQTLGRADEAQQALDRALAIDPTDAQFTVSWRPTGGSSRTIPPFGLSRR